MNENFVVDRKKICSKYKLIWQYMIEKFIEFNEA